MNSKTVTTGKMVTAAAAMLVAFAMIGTATFAWYTISRQADSSGMGISIKVDESEIPIVISTSQDGEYTNTMSFMDAFSGLDVSILRPISTSDGVHWYLPDYDKDGNVIGLTWNTDSIEVIGQQATTTAINLNNLTPAMTMAASGGGIEEDTSGSALKYLVYADVWIKLRDYKEGSNSNRQYKLCLNNPNSLQSIIADGEEEFFGSVALAKPTTTSVGGVTKYTTDTENGHDAVASLRIGFRFYNMYDSYGHYKTDVSDADSKFWIYEPAANIRSSYINSVLDDATNTNTQNKDVNYSLIQDKTTINASTYQTIYQATSNSAVETWLPVYDNDTSYHLVAASTNPKCDGLIRQNASEWDDSKLQAVTGTNKYNCTCLKSIGSFITGSAITSTNGGVSVLYTTEIADMSEMLPMTTLKDDKPQKVRIYIWIEGQDIDCWNPVASGNLFINLELKGQKVN